MNLRTMRMAVAALLLTAAGTTAAQPAATQPDGNGTSVRPRNLTDIMTDSVVASRRLIYFGDDDMSRAPEDSVNRLIYKFYADQYRHFHDPLAPYFMFMSKDASLAMGVGGCVRMRAYYDWGGAVPASGFAPYLIPMTPDPARRRAFGTTPAGTALFFRVIGRNKTLGDYQLYIMADFSGYSSRDFKLKKAYAIINDWTIGYANSTFSDPSALPPVIDASGPNCKMSATNVLVRWMHTLPGGVTVAASVETPQSAIATDGTSTADVSQYIPDIAASCQYEWGQGNHLRIAAIGRSLPYRDLIAGRNHNIIGWGAQLTTVLRPHPAVTVYGCFNGGYGYAGLGGDWLVGQCDLLADPEQRGIMYAPATFGGYAALQYNIRHDLFVSSTFSASRLCPRKPVGDDTYDRGMYVAANIFWNPTARIQVGVEYNLGFRRNTDGRQRHAQRLGAMAQFSF